MYITFIILSLYIITSNSNHHIPLLHCYRNLQKAEAKLEKLGSALSEVDRKVAGLRDKFEKTTTEATRLKIDLDKATETITAAENLVGKLDGEFTRWSAQVFILFSSYSTRVCTSFVTNHKEVLLILNVLNE